MSDEESPSYFDKPRSIAASVLFAAGVAAIIGSFLDWVVMTPPSILQERLLPGLEPFNGLETDDGWIILVTAGVLMLSAVLLFLTKKSLWGWLGFFASMVMGAVSIADYRGIDTLAFDEERRIGLAADPGFGLTLVVEAALIGVASSVAGVAASPRPDEETA